MVIDQCQVLHSLRNHLSFGEVQVSEKTLVLSEELVFTR